MLFTTKDSRPLATQPASSPATSRLAQPLFRLGICSDRGRSALAHQCPGGIRNLKIKLTSKFKVLMPWPGPAPGPAQAGRALRPSGWPCVEAWSGQPRPHPTVTAAADVWINGPGLVTMNLEGPEPGARLRRQARVTAASPPSRNPTLTWVDGKVAGLSVGHHGLCKDVGCNGRCT